MSNGLGWNIDGLFLPEQNRVRLLSLMKANPPKAVVVLTNINYAIEIKKALPNTEVIFRQFWGNEYDNIYTTTAPDQYLSIYNDALKNGLTIYTSNEPRLTPQLVDWEVEVGSKVLARNGKAVMFNWSVGAPNTGDNEYVQWRRGLELISKNRGRLHLGLHEYFLGHPFLEFGYDSNTSSWPTSVGGKPWVMGRYRHILDYCDRTGLKRPSIIFTEFGYDQVGALVADNWQKIPGYKSPMLLHNAKIALENWGSREGISWVEYSTRSIQRIWNVMYKPSLDVIGACFFPMGGTGIWGDASIHKYPDLVKKLSEGSFETVYNSGNVTEPNTEIIGMNLGVSKRVEWTGGLVNLREISSVGGKVLMVLNAGTTGVIFDKKVVDSGGYKWMLGMFTNNTGESVLGWFATNISNSKWKLIS